MYACQLHYCLWITHTLQPSKGAFLAKGTQRGEEGPKGGRASSAALASEKSITRAVSSLPRTPREVVSTAIHLVWFFNSSPYLKMPFLPSSSILYFYHKERNYHISQIILCCIQTTKFSHHNLLSPEPAPTIFFLPSILTSPVWLLWFHKVSLLVSPAYFWSISTSSG